MTAFGPKPSLAWLPIGKVSVDAKYQRDTASRRSRNLIEKIAANFRWSRFGVVLAVKHADGWFVIDGQHRVEACRQIGIASIPAVVLPHATVEEAAADFVAINRDRVAVTSLHIHHAQLAAGDPEAKAIERACRAAGVATCRFSPPGQETSDGAASSKTRRTLNPLFVEWLMGWPVNWTWPFPHTDSPSQAPMNISDGRSASEPIGCGSAGTAWSLWKLRMRGELSRLLSEAPMDADGQIRMAV